MLTFPSTLIIAPSVELASQKAAEFIASLDHQLLNDPDLFLLDDYTIATVRQLKKFLSQKAFNHNSKLVYIPNADLLNPESQNALLKTLEEPGENNYLLLTTTKKQLLLPTIISRCHLVRLKSSVTPTETALWPISSQPKKDLELASTLNSDKNAIKNLLLAQLYVYQQQLVKSPQKNNAQIIKKLITALNYIDSNVDPKSALDYFFLA